MKTTVETSIPAFKKDSLDLWKSCPIRFSPDGRRYSREQQLLKEDEVDRLMNDVDACTDAFRRAGERIGKKRFLELRARIQKAIVQLLHSFDCVIDQKMESSFSDVTDKFISRAYDFDPAINDEAVYQASRNVLIMNTIQMHLGLEITLTPSVLAYSLLYPYTDNYLDAAEIDLASKRELSGRLLIRLTGISVPADHQLDRTVDRLVSMIEREFDRTIYPCVYESMLGIHRAQMRSIMQYEGVALTASELLDISIEKGGTSVLADGYLVAGNLSPEDAQFFFRFGVLLQLIDDLQDLEEDYARGERTLVGLTASREPLDAFVLRLLSFLEGVVAPVSMEESHDRQQLRVLIERSCRLLIFESIAAHERRYTREFLSTMESHSAVSFAHLRSVQARLRSKSRPDGNDKSLRKLRQLARRQMQTCE